MEQQETSDVLTRERGEVSSSVQTTVPRSSAPRTAGGTENFTAHNAEFDRRTIELRKTVIRNRAAAESELARLSRRCDILKEFLFESDSTAENLENLKSLINAEKEFSLRLDQLEMRYYKFLGRFSDKLTGEAVSEGRSETPSAAAVQHSFKDQLPVAGGIILGALIIALTLMAIFL
jgi:hypothetical protein